MDNPLVGYRGLPPFAAIRPANAEPALDKGLAENHAAVSALLTQAGNHQTWKHTLCLMEEINDALNRSWSPIGHLHTEGVIASEKSVNLQGHGRFRV